MKREGLFFPSAKLKKVDKANYLYVIVNIGLSAFSFLRSFVFMQVLDLRGLGVISLVQTIFMFIGLLQMGLLNGGFRIVSLGKNEELNRTNNTIYSYLSILLPLGVIFCILSNYFHWIKELSLELLIISVVFGIITLLNNWYHNILIGEQKLSEVNLLNIVSYTVSACLLPTAYMYGFWGGMMVIMAQPLVFVCLGLFRNKEFVPNKFFFDIKYIRYILHFGFIPFLGGILLSIYLQVERWSITEVLGVEALGGFYLVFLYVSLYQLIPNSINSIFFPKCIKSYSEKNYSNFKSLLKYYYLTIVAYGGAIALVTSIFLEPVVSLVFPQHLPGVALVYIILPGLIIQSLSDPIALVLNSSVILKPMLIVNLINMIFCVMMVFVLIFLKKFTLESVASIRMMSGVLILLSYVVTYFLIRKKLYL